MRTCKDILMLYAEEGYRDFSASLVPNIPKERILGVRLPRLRSISRELTDAEREELFSNLPHSCIEEDHLHSFLICKIKDYDEAIGELERFLPYVDNWAVCDSLRPTVFNKNREKLLFDIDKWLKSEHIYTKRFAVEMLMIHFLDEKFSSDILERAFSVERGENYYLDMMIAWFFATSLAKRWEETIPYIENKRLDSWTHNKAISKAKESRRVSEEHKEYLNSLRMKL